jgi:hypothetical protein
MTPEQRKIKVDMLFQKIALIAEINESNPSKMDQLIKPMVASLWALTQEQEKLHELDYKRIGIDSEGCRGDAWEDINVEHINVEHINVEHASVEHTSVEDSSK